MPENIYLEVEESENCPYMPMMAYEAHRTPVPISRVRIDEMGKPPGVYEVTGWSSEGGGTSCPAMYTPVSDSGAVEVHLIYGGDWGVRLKPAGSEEEWDIGSPNQYGEPYLMLIEEGDVLLD
jgi:hypothetical protein